MAAVQTGLEAFIKTPPRWISGYRLGLLSNPASIDSRFYHARELIHHKFPGQLRALFAPQHGFFAEKQDNMIESADYIDPVLDIPVFSLYSQTRRPSRDMFDYIDILIVDLLDVGTRVYTFSVTMSYCLEAAKKFGKKVLILDRPNPVTGSIVEGNCLSEDCASFVGRYSIPMRHGLTMGELALLFNDRYHIDCDLEVHPMKGWKRSMYFKDTGLAWIPPSPNLPTPDSAIVYPGQVLWEGTNVSEGRGTTQPFELFGAPFIDSGKILNTLEAKQIGGAVLRPVVFEPISNKWESRACKGFQIHITDPYMYKPYLTTLTLLNAVRIHHSKDFLWKPPPYEYELKRLPIDLIIGSKKIRQRIEAFDDIGEIEKSWKKELAAFKEMCRQYYLYN